MAEEKDDYFLEDIDDSSEEIEQESGLVEQKIEKKQEELSTVADEEPEIKEAQNSKTQPLEIKESQSQQMEHREDYYSNITVEHIDQEDLEFMSSLSAAVLQRTRKKSRTVLWFWIFFIVAFLTWTSVTEIDEITRGSGKVIPAGQNQIIQNLEGGIVSEILTEEGSRVKKGTPLLKLENKKFIGNYAENQSRLKELQSRVVRLTSESEGVKFNINSSVGDEFEDYIKQEEALYYSDMKKLESQKRVLKNQLKQRRVELADARSKVKFYSYSYSLVVEEIEVTEPLVKEGLQPRMDFLKLRREANELKEKRESAKLSIPRLKAVIKEYENKIRQADAEFKNIAKTELTEVLAEIERIESSTIALKDQLTRTTVLAPEDGIIKKIHVNTIGGVVQPGMDLIEFVPTDHTLIVETKIKPSDIAFLFPGQKAILKFSAYDFAIFGGLNGEVKKISIDTIEEEKDESFYLVYIETMDRTFDKSKETLEIMPGMTVSIDVITGKKSILSYILKPVLRSKEYALSER